MMYNTLWIVWSQFEKFKKQFKFLFEFCVLKKKCVWSRGHAEWCVGGLRCRRRRASLRFRVPSFDVALIAFLLEHRPCKLCTKNRVHAEWCVVQLTLQTPPLFGFRSFFRCRARVLLFFLNCQLKLHVPLSYILPRGITMQSVSRALRSVRGWSLGICMTSTRGRIRMLTNCFAIHCVTAAMWNIPDKRDRQVGMCCNY